MELPPARRKAAPIARAKAKASVAKPKACLPERYVESLPARAAREAKHRQALEDAQALEEVKNAKEAVRQAKGKTAKDNARKELSELREKHAGALRRSCQGISGWKNWQSKAVAKEANEEKKKMVAPAEEEGKEE